MPKYDLSFWVGLIDLAQVNLQRAENEQTKLESAEILTHNLRHLSALLEEEKRAISHSIPASEFDAVILQISFAANSCDRFVDQLQKGTPGTPPKPVNCAAIRQLIAK